MNISRQFIDTVEKNNEKFENSEFKIKDLVMLEKGSKLSRETSVVNVTDNDSFNIKNPLIVQDNKYNVKYLEDNNVEILRPKSNHNVKRVKGIKQMSLGSKNVF